MVKKILILAFAFLGFDGISQINLENLPERNNPSGGYLFWQLNQITRKVKAENVGASGISNMYIINDTFYLVTALNTYFVQLPAGGAGGTDDQNATEVPLSPLIDVDGNGANETNVQEALGSLRIYGTYQDHADAGANGVPLNGHFYASDDNKMGAIPGDIIRRRY